MTLEEQAMQLVGVLDATEEQIATIGARVLLIIRAAIAEEREACAKICNAKAMSLAGTGSIAGTGQMQGAFMCESAIRART